ncbi:MAG: Rieske (2Fe-2S) protein [Hyphomicrobiaceae bacterium]|nr:Rieske (2Fe-2S) protein [Hyphomicrobiaceae bacterium]
MTAAPDGKVARSGRAGRGDRIVVGPVDGFGPGERRIVAHGRRSIGVFNVGGNYYALANVCPHAGGPLCEGEVTGTTETGERPYELAWVRGGEILRCPWHAWEVDIKSGRVLVGRQQQVRTFKVSVVDGTVVLEV